MPRLLPNIPRVLDLPGSDVLVYLTSEQHRFLMAIAPELLWNATGDFTHDENTRDIAEQAHVALVEGLPVHLLLEKWDEEIAVLTEQKDCICAMAGFFEILITDGLPTTLPTDPNAWPGTPNFPYPEDEPIQENHVGNIPEPIDTHFLSPYSGWEKWTDYVCHATHLIKDASTQMADEIADFMGSGAVTFALLAALLTGMFLTGIGLGLPLIVFGLGAASTLWAACLQLGQSGFEDVSEWLDVSCDWEEIACILKSSLNSLSAETAVRNYLAANAPPLLTPGLLALPWQSWIEQIYRGESTEGEYLFVDPSAVSDLCENCDPPTPGEGFWGTEVDGCVLSYWEWLGGGSAPVLFDDGVACAPNTFDVPAGFVDGFKGSTFAPVTYQSPIFSVPETGEYKFSYKARKFSGSSAITMIIVDAHNNVDLGNWGMPTNEVDSTSLVFVIPIPLQADFPYRMKIMANNKLFACDDDSVEPNV